jgi:hypothetical protein
VSRPVKPPNKPGKRSPGSFKAILTRLNPEGWRALRMLAVEQDTTLNALAVEAFNDLLKKHGKKASVENPLLD